MELQMIKVGRCRRYAVVLATLLSVAMLQGCEFWRKPTMNQLAVQRGIDRSIMDYPSGVEAKLGAFNLTAPCALGWVTTEGPYKGSMIVAEAGVGDFKPRIYGFKPDGTRFDIYPKPQKFPFGILPQSDMIYGPIGGMVVSGEEILVTHRDVKGRGVISSFGLTGLRSTVVADLPAEGDYPLTDIAIHPISGRLWFGLGAATNSGVVGVDNWEVGWVNDHPEACDLPAVSLKILGYRYFTRNPGGGWFRGPDNVGTAPFHPFGKRNLLTIPPAPNDRPTSAIYSVSPTGGDLRVEAHGIRMPRGLAFDEFGNLFGTNNGMELRGTRPVKDDPDVLLKILPRTWYGFPDFSTTLYPVSDKRFEPPKQIMDKLEYPELSFLIDHVASMLSDPGLFRETVLLGEFPWQSGAAKLGIVPATAGLKPFRGNAIVALNGDRSPFATGGVKLNPPVGGKVVRVDPTTHQVEDFVRNTRGVPASMQGKDVEALERPIDIKFGPDGRLYIVDYGQMEMRDGREMPKEHTGRIFVLDPIPAATAKK
jgi:sugar lactone lactonase YvrE